MPALAHPRRERFARAYAERALDPSISPRAVVREAARIAGYPGTCSKAAHHYQIDFRREEVKERIRELMQEANRHSDIRIERLLVQLDHVASVNFKNFIDASGAVRPLNQLSEQDLSCIKKIDYNSHTGLPKRIEFHDKLRALEILVKHLRGPDVHNHQHVTVNISDEQRIAALMSLLSKVDPDEPKQVPQLPALPARPDDDFVMSEDTNDES